MLRIVTLLLLLLDLLSLSPVTAFSVPLDSDGSFALFDRFRPTCPADVGAVRLFDTSLVTVGDDNDHPVQAAAATETWVAVYRSANNKPSVFVKDQFLNAMRIATSVPTAVPTGAPNEGIETTRNSILEATETPVAIARLTLSLDFENCWLLDNMRCMLKKEETNSDCDGGSEHTEALSVAIDSVLIHHLTNNRNRHSDTENPNANAHFIFDGTIRTKATLVSAPLLEQRGFKEVTSLSRDMATHTCSLDACMESYASRAVSTSNSKAGAAKGPGARKRAIHICSLLGQIDRENDLKLSASAAKSEEENVDDEYDPWAGLNNLNR